MTTSGSTNFIVTRNDILQSALRRINILASGEDMTARQQSEAVITLNLMIKEWMAEGINLWTTEWAMLFLVAGQEEYILSSTTSDHFVHFDDLNETTMRIAGVSSDTILEVTTTAGMIVGDKIGIVIGTTIHWTTISSVTDSDTVVITTGLDGAAAVSNKVWWYTSNMNRPLNVISARRRTIDGNDISVFRIAREEYEFQSNKSASGTVVQVYYDKERDKGKLYVWPTASDEREQLVVTVQRPIEDFDNAVDNPDFPVEWSNALIWNLAVELGIEYAVPLQTLQLVERRAVISKTVVSDFDREDHTSVYLKIEEYPHGG